LGGIFAKFSIITKYFAKIEVFLKNELFKKTMCPMWLCGFKNCWCVGN